GPRTTRAASRWKTRRVPAADPQPTETATDPLTTAAAPDGIVTTDVAVVGLGAWGSQALWRLAARGVDAVGIEQFAVGHALGSTHGRTRLFRELCLEHPGLTPVAVRARELWRELEQASGTELLTLTGGVMVGPRHGRVVAGVLAAGEAAGRDLEVLTAPEVRERFPVLATTADDHDGVLDPGAGIARPEAGVRAAVDAARTAGARTVRARVESVEEESGGVLVRLAGGGAVRARQVVLAAGAWTGALTGLPLQPRRVPMFWFTGRERAATDPGGILDLARFPVVIRELDDGRCLWGHGSSRPGQRDGFDVKLGLDDDGSADLGFSDAEPDHLDRSIAPGRDAAALGAAARLAYPAVEPVPRSGVACMYTRSPDGQFVVGRLPGRERVLVAGGDSGHGHKHAPAVGELLAQAVAGERSFTDVDFMRPGR
ncbi:MAG TPA: N-methyl-L-tryptophan oxidase, partial [Enterobacter roggenkampii]|nr:N-methyl-L-tryptophan oxidase [Enterobacter roggenkampii]